MARVLIRYLNGISNWLAVEFFAFKPHPLLFVHELYIAARNDTTAGADILNGPGICRKTILNNAHHVLGVVSVPCCTRNFTRNAQFSKKHSWQTTRTNRRPSWAFIWKSYSRRGRQGNQKRSLWSVLQLPAKAFSWRAVFGSFEKFLSFEALTLFLSRCTGSSVA